MILSIGCTGLNKTLSVTSERGGGANNSSSSQLHFSPYAKLTSANGSSLTSRLHTQDEW